MTFNCDWKRKLLYNCCYRLLYKMARDKSVEGSQCIDCEHIYLWGDNLPSWMSDFLQTDRRTYFVNELNTQLVARFEIKYNEKLNKDFEKELFILFSKSTFDFETAYKKLRQMKKEEFV